MQHYGLSAPCDLGHVNEKINGTFSERLLVETLPCRRACIEFIMQIHACCYKILQELKSRFYHAFHFGNTGMQKVSMLAEGSQGKLYSADPVNINRW